MSANALLLWMSARGVGSWAQFRAAVESLHVPAEEEASDETGAVTDLDPGGLSLHQYLRLSLQRLAHAEFFAAGCEEGWRVAPPVLALRQTGNQWTGILCGARAPHTSTAIQSAARRNGVGAAAQEHQGMPPRILLTGELDPMTRLATELQITPQLDAPLAMLNCCPAIDDPSQVRPKVLPVGGDWLIDEFDPQGVEWVARQELGTRPNGSLLRFRYLYERYHFLTFSHGSYLVPGQVGKYIMLRRARQTVLSYDAPSQVLTVPAICRPPLLIERALDLCSGKLPEADRRSLTLTYKDIPPTVAHLAARLLRQEL